MINFLNGYRRDRYEKRKHIAADILVILVVVKFALEFAIDQGSGIASILGAAFMVAALLAVAIRWARLRNIISIGAIVLFLIDYHFKAGVAGSTVLFVMILVLIAFYFILKFIG